MYEISWNESNKGYAKTGKNQYKIILTTYKTPDEDNKNKHQDKKSTGYTGFFLSQNDKVHRAEEHKISQRIIAKAYAPFME